MPPQRAPKGVDFFTRLQQAQQEVEGTPIQFGQVELPPNLNFIAELRKVTIGTVQEGKKTAGQRYFRAEGKVVHPVMFNGERVQGRVTSIMETLADTPDAMGERKTMEQHWAWVRNELGKLLGGPEQVDEALAGISSDEELQGWFEELSQAGIHFNGRTWLPPKRDDPNAGEPRIIHLWLGFTEFQPPEPGGDMVDTTARPGNQRATAQAPATAPSRPTQPTKPTSQPQRPTTPPTRPSGPGKPPVAPNRPAAPTGPAQRGRPPVAPPRTADDIDPHDDPNEGDDVDHTETPLDELVMLCDPDGDNDPGAQNELSRRAIAFGEWTQDEVDAAENWQIVADYIMEKEAEAEGSGAAPEDNEPAAPEPVTGKDVGDVFLYHPLDKSRKPSKKAVECELIFVNPKKKTATLKNMVSQTEYKDVPLADVIRQ